MKEGYDERDVCVTECLLDYWGVDADAFEKCIEKCEEGQGVRQ